MVSWCGCKIPTWCWEVNKLNSSRARPVMYRPWHWSSLSEDARCPSTSRYCATVMFSTGHKVRYDLFKMSSAIMISSYLCWSYGVISNGRRYPKISRGFASVLELKSAPACLSSYIFVLHMLYSSIWRKSQYLSWKIDGFGNTCLKLIHICSHLTDDVMQANIGVMLHQIDLKTFIFL